MNNRPSGSAMSVGYVKLMCPPCEINISTKWSWLVGYVGLMCPRGYMRLMCPSHGTNVLVVWSQLVV